MRKYLDYRSERILVVCTLIMSIFIQMFIIERLPAKYFYDSDVVLSITNNTSTKYWDDSYMFTGEFYKKINLFDFTTFEQWATLLTAIVSIMILIYLGKYKKIEIYKWIIIYITLIFANIYIFRISKDFIQFLFWVLVYLGFNIKKQFQQNIFFLTIFLFQIIYFREYYVGIIGLYILLKMLNTKKKKVNAKKLCVIMGIIIFFTLVIVKTVDISLYNRVVNVRSSTNEYRDGSSDAQTMITDVLSSSDPLLYMVNYIINNIRILFPIELVTLGIKYAPFVIYQVAIVLCVGAELKKAIDEKNEKLKDKCYMLVAYVLVASIFEPDFGSVIRHEVAVMYIVLDVILYSNKEVSKKSKHREISQKYNNL